MFTFSPNIAVNVRKLDSAVSFYKDVLGINVSMPSESATNEIGQLSAELKPGFGLTVALDGCNPQQEPYVGMVFFEFKCDDLEAGLKLLEAKGCKLGKETLGDGFRGRMVTDLFGMRFHVYAQK